MSNYFQYLSKFFVHFYSELNREIFISRKKYLRKGAEFVIFVYNRRRNYYRTEAYWRRSWELAFAQNNIFYDIVYSLHDLKDYQSVIWYPNQISFPSNIQFTKFASDKIINLAEELEKRVKNVYPNKYASSIQENKVNMHKLFSIKKIPTPYTIIVNNFDELVNYAKRLDFPFVIKGPFSNNSKHFDLIENSSILNKFISNFQQKGNLFNNINFPILLQEYLKIISDVRITFVGDKILNDLIYWRIKKKLSQQTTATRYGSEVIFKQIPKQYDEFLSEIIKKFDIPWGGIDLTWVQQDLSQNPIVLEVSPIFSPNPPIPAKFIGDYNKFKNSISLKNNWVFHYWKTINYIAKEQIKLLIKG